MNKGNFFLNLDTRLAVAIFVAVAAMVLYFAMDNRIQWAGIHGPNGEGNSPVAAVAETPTPAPTATPDVVATAWAIVEAGRYVDVIYVLDGPRGAQVNVVYVDGYRGQVEERVTLPRTIKTQVPPGVLTHVEIGYNRGETGGMLRCTLMADGKIIDRREGATRTLCRGLAP